MQRGTAAPVRSWLLVEQPGAWSRAALAETLAAALAPADRRRLGHLQREQLLRALLVRRPGRTTDPSGPRTVLVGSAVPGEAWLERLVVPDLRALADLDLEAVAAGRPGHGEPVDGPALLVCTHGAKDMCCAVEGRPLARALEAVHGDRVWECSHVGGDRFAGNLVVAPHGEYHGHLDPAGALTAAAAAVAGRVELAGFRGRSAYDPWQQTAEHAVRVRTGLLGRDEVRCGPSREDSGRVHVTVSTRRGAFAVQMERRVQAEVAASRCRGPVLPVDYAVVALTPAG
nr:sucrase ferredoxin [Motilibacter deserti]